MRRLSLDNREERIERCKAKVARHPRIAAARGSGSRSHVAAFEADGGSSTVRDVPGAGCVFTIEMSRRPLHRANQKTRRLARRCGARETLVS